MSKLLGVMLVILVGCGPAPIAGAPVVGATCGTSALPECITASEVGYCESGKWVEYACPGECRNAQNPRCNWSLSDIGTVCPPANEGTAFCGTANRMMRCLSGKYAAVECASGCTTSGTTIMCR